MDTDNQHNSILKGYNMLLYFAGTMIMYEPSEECIADFWTNGILKNLPVSSSNPTFIKAASQLRESCLDKNLCGKAMTEDYKRLFSRGGLTLVSVYESYYSNNPGQGKSLVTSSVTDFYDSYGWISKFKGKVSDDHLSVELLFLTLLVDKYMVMDDQACRVEMKNEILRFLDQHILSWVPEWNDRIQKNANTLCFKGIGTLILACAEDIYSILDKKVTESVATGHLRN
jgi:TorA maturation chaperone TorD